MKATQNDVARACIYALSAARADLLPEKIQTGVCARNDVQIATQHEIAQAPAKVEPS